MKHLQHGYCSWLLACCLVVLAGCTVPQHPVPLVDQEPASLQDPLGHFNRIVTSTDGRVTK